MSYSPTTRPLWKEMLASFGFFSYLLSIIVLFIVIVEYDPTGKIFKQEGTYHIMQVEEGGQSVKDEQGKTYPLLRIPTKSPHPPQSMGGYLHPTKEGFLPEYLIPHVPRNAEDMVIPLFFLFLSIVFMRLAPSVLFVDVLAHD